MEVKRSDYVRFFIPLFAYDLLILISSVVRRPFGVSEVLQHLMFLSGFSIAYFFGIRESVKNVQAVVKFKQKSPMLVPLVFFVISSLLTAVVLIPGEKDAVPMRVAGIATAVFAYVCGMFVMYRFLNAEFRESVPAGKQCGGLRKRLLLINPVDTVRGGLTNSESSRFPPLGLGIIAALTPEDEYETVLIDENFESFEYMPADLVGITAFTAAAPRAYEIASLYRENGIPVVMGGIHASMMTEEALRYVDCVVVGEAEPVWPVLLRDFSGGMLKPVYESPLIDLKNMPVPKREIFDPRYPIVTVQTSRGCPMDCSFCSVTPFNGRKFRQRPVEEVLDELESIEHQYIFFIDDNIIGHSRAHKERALRLFRGMVDRGLDKRWFCQSSMNFGEDDELLRWARKAGCRMVFLGIESPDNNELAEVDKNLNRKINYKQVLRSINRNKIAVLGAFINGTDHETGASLKCKADYILKNRIDVIQATILTPLPGTRLFDRLLSENRLLFTDFPEDWKRYDMTELTYRLQNLSGERFSILHGENTRRFYSRKNLLKMFFRTAVATKSLECAFWAYNSNANYRAAAVR